jgi:hypothetical protein
MNLFKQIAANQIYLEEFKFFSELNIEAFIIENPDVISNDEDLKNPKIIYQQLSFHDGRGIDRDGRIDLLAKTEGGYLIIIEIKNHTLTEKDLKQLEDYIEGFPKDKVNILNRIENGNDYKDYPIKGLLVGIDITTELKEKLQNDERKEKNVIGLTIKRFRSNDKKECYITTDLFQPKSGVYKRFESWQEFEGAQNKRGISKGIIELAKQLHDDFKNLSINLSINYINYTPTTFTLNVPKTQRRRVFAYVILQKNNLKIYLHCNGTLPEGGILNPNQDRYNNEYFITISKASDYNENIKKMIRDSYEIINAGVSPE